MTRQHRDTRAAILGAAYDLFYRQGFNRVSIDAIAERAGVTKRTVYYHFASKDDLAAAALEAQHTHLLAQYESWLGTDKTDAQSILDHLFDGLARWGNNPKWLGSGYSRLSAELAEMPGHPARKVAAKHKRAIAEWLTERLELAGVSDAKTRAAEVLTLIEGAMALALIHGDQTHFEISRQAARRLLPELSRTVSSRI